MKKLNKLVAILVALAMMAALCVTSAFAAWDETKDATPDQATLTKRVETPKETTLKPQTFTFTFDQQDTAEELANETYAVETASAPIGTRDISIANANKVDPKGDNDVYVNTKALFADPSSVKGTTAEKPFPHAGVYKYIVTETVGYTAAAGETIHNSQAQYTVYITVANTADGTDLYIKDYTVIKDKTDGNTEYVPGEGQTNKIDEDGNGGDTITTPGQEGQESTVTPVGSQFAWTNTYVKTLSTDPDAKPDDPNDQDPKDTKDDTALYIQKKVDDAAAPGQIDLTKDFTFNVKVDLPSLANGDVTAYIVKEGMTIPEDLSTLPSKTFKDNVAQDVNLKHNERLVFASLPVGTVYTAVETGLDEQKYTANTTATDTDKITNPGVTAGVIKGSDTKNNVLVTNALSSSNTPTGILISNLPYIALALVAIGGLVAYVVVRRRQNDEA